MNPPSIVAVIPARYASTRFPGKPLADRTGWPLIRHVHERVTRTERIERVVVATDDDRIASAVAGFGGEVVMTSPEHPNGTCRVAEAVAGIPCELIVNVQGDEPEIDPAVIDAGIDALIERPDCPIGTVASPFASDEDPADPNIVKVVVDRAGRALYFSRALIPHDRDGTGRSRPLKHVGLYVYRREFLFRYVELAPTPLEQAEHLEQLRVLEHGVPMAVAITTAHHHGIDTPEQYRQFVEREKAIRDPGA